MVECVGNDVIILYLMVLDVCLWICLQILLAWLLFYADVMNLVVLPVVNYF